MAKRAPAPLAWAGLFAAAVFQITAAAQTPSKPDAEKGAASSPPNKPVKVTFVRQSREPLTEPLQYPHQLPRTFSVDPLTPQEILEVQRTNFRFSDDDSYKPHPSQPPYSQSWAASPGACMQWLFLRHTPDEPWRAVGAKGPGGTFVKVNGAFRAAHMYYMIESKPDKSKSYSWEMPGEGPGSGVSTLRSLIPFSSLGEYLNRKKERSLETINPPGAPKAYFTLLGVKKLIVAHERTQCTHLRATCRRYVGQVFPGFGTFSVKQDLPGGRIRTEEPVMFEADPALATELAIEDMCPFGSFAMVQRPLNSRMSGGSGMVKLSFPENPGLRGALRPFVEGAK